MDFRVKSNGKIQAVAEGGTPLGGEFTFHYTFFRAYGEDGNTLSFAPAGPTAWPNASNGVAELERVP